MSRNIERRDLAIIMRGLATVLFLSLLIGTMFIQKTNLSIVKASPDVYQGDLILNGNNVTTLEGRHDINGSIIVEENATLILRNAVLNLTQATSYEYNLTLKNPLNGNPRLLAYNSTIISDDFFSIFAFVNSTVTLNNSTASAIVGYQESFLSISNRSSVDAVIGMNFAVVNIDFSEVNTCVGYYSSSVQVYDSNIQLLSIGPTSVNCTVSSLTPGLFSYWNFITNCSVTVSGMDATNVTLINTSVDQWQFLFYGNSNTTILYSTLSSIAAMDYSVVRLKSSNSTTASAWQSGFLSITDSVLLDLSVWETSRTQLTNSTYVYGYIHDSAVVYVSWYVDVTVLDSIGQSVPSANVIATYPNGTVAESRLTDANGTAGLTLMEKMMNSTGEYPLGNYTLGAVYGLHSYNATLNMTGNKEITLTLDFVIPEFPSFLIIPIFMIGALLAVIVYKRKRNQVSN